MLLSDTRAATKEDIFERANVEKDAEHSGYLSNTENFRLLYN